MFLTPFDGMTVASPDGQTLSFKDGRWLIGVLKISRLQIEGREMLGGPVPSLREPEGGETIDLEARGTLSQIVRLLRAHGLAAV